jgi:hypothetical protein
VVILSSLTIALALVRFAVRRRLGKIFDHEAARVLVPMEKKVGMTSMKSPLFVPRMLQLSSKPPSLYIPSQRSGYTISPSVSIGTNVGIRIRVIPATPEKTRLTEV